MESGIRESEQHREVLSVKEVAEYLGVSESIIRRLVRDRKIPFNRIEARILFYLPAVREWIIQTAIRPDMGVDDRLTERTGLDENTIWKRVQGGR